MRRCLGAAASATLLTCAVPLSRLAWLQAAALRSCMARLIKQRSRGVIQPRSFGGVLGELAKQVGGVMPEVGGAAD